MIFQRIQLENAHISYLGKHQVLCLYIQIYKLNVLNLPLKRKHFIGFLFYGWQDNLLGLLGKINKPK